MTDYYDDYFFTSSLTNHQCPELALDCSPASACARDPNTGATYCCDASNNQCWRGTTDCANDGSTTECGSGDNSWCCLSKTEICTQAEGQIGLCWNTVPSTLFGISGEVLNDAYLSLSSASPKASSFIFTPMDLIAQTQTASSSTAAHSTSASTTSSSSPSSLASTTSQRSGSPTSASPSSSSLTPSSSAGSPGSSADSPTSHSSSSSSSSQLSSGAIAGIVIASVAVIAFIVAATLYFLQQRRKAAVGVPAAVVSYEPAKKAEKTYYELQYSPIPSELQSHVHRDPQELPGYM